CRGGRALRRDRGGRRYRLQGDAAGLGRGHRRADRGNKAGTRGGRLRRRDRAVRSRIGRALSARRAQARRTAEQVGRDLRVRHDSRLGSSRPSFDLWPFVGCVLSDPRSRLGVFGVHAYEEWRGEEAPLWRVFGAIVGLWVPNWLGFLSFTLLL